MRTSQHATYGYAVADGEHVMKSAVKHWIKLAGLGATEAEKKRFAQGLAEAARILLIGGVSGAVGLEAARQLLKDLVGAYRSAASLIVHGIDGRDAKAEQALKMKGPFPGNDKKLSSYASGLGAPMRSFSAKLAARGFGKEKQAALLEATAVFEKAFAARGKERGTARSQTMAREATFKELRTCTSYFRRVGREALRNSVARADFDRVKLPVAKPAAAPAPSPTAKSA
jgi:hypothetical protein